MQRLTRMPTTSHTALDVRDIAPRERYARALAAYRALSAGQAFDLVNDHDPSALYDQLQAEMPGLFSWDYLERGPQAWRVRIARLASAGSATQCCGHCM